MKNKKIFIPVVIFALLMIVLLIPEDHEIVFETSGSFAFIRLYDVSQLKRTFIEKEIKGLCNRYENTYSPHIKGSLVYELNHSKKAPKDSELLLLVRKGLDLSGKTRGVYDITVRPLSDVWGFSDMKEPEIPSPDRLAEALGRIDANSIHIGVRDINIGNEQEIDPGAFSKGLLIDRIYDLLKEEKIECIVEIGGDIRVYSENDRVFDIGIRHPRKSSILRTISLSSEEAVATSGDYERSFKKNGRIYHHLLSAKTGMPVRYQASVSVVSDSCFEADALSTVFFLMGKEWVQKNKDSFLFREAVFSDEEGNVTIIKKG